MILSRRPAPTTEAPPLRSLLATLAPLLAVVACARGGATLPWTETPFGRCLVAVEAFYIGDFDRTRLYRGALSTLAERSSLALAVESGARNGEALEVRCGEARLALPADARLRSRLVEAERDFSAFFVEHCETNPKMPRWLPPGLAFSHAYVEQLELESWILHGEWFRQGPLGEATLPIAGVRHPRGGIEVLELGPEGAPSGSRLTVGSEIVSIDGLSTRDLPLDTASFLMAGEPGSDVEIRFFTPDGGLHTERLVRSPDAWLPSVDPAQRIGEAAYIRIRTFEETTASELRTALESVEGAPLLILDVRANFIGWSGSAIEAAELLVPPGRPIAHFFARDEADRQLVRSIHPRAVRFDRVVVVTDATTTGASELFAGALRVVGGAKLAGAPTAGFGYERGMHYLGDLTVLWLTQVRIEVGRDTRIPDDGLRPDHPWSGDTRLVSPPEADPLIRWVAGSPD